MKFVTRVSSFFAPSTVTGGQTGKSYILFCLCTFPFATPCPAQKEMWRALNPCEDPHRSSDRLRRRAPLGGYLWNTPRSATLVFRFISRNWRFHCSVIRCCVRCPPSRFRATEDMTDVATRPWRTPLVACRRSRACLHSGVCQRSINRFP